MTHSILTPKQATPDVRVNGVRIEPEAIASEAQHHPAARPELAWKAAAEALAIKEALLQAARERDLKAEPQQDEDGREESEEDALIRALLEREVITPDPDEESLRRYFENNRQKLRTPDIFEPEHILLQARADDADAYEKAREQAQVLIKHLGNKPDDFARLARDRSDCASSGEGGALGQVVRGETTPEFEAAMAALEPGELCSEPVETPYGFHVIRLRSKLPGKPLDFDAARPLVEEFLRDASWRRAVAQFVALVVGASKIEGVKLDGASSPLVQ